MNTRWVVVTTKANRENWALENLARQDCPYYFPRTMDIVRSHGRRELRSRPLFSRHIFVEVSDRWKFLSSTLGVQGVIMMGDGPAYMQKKIIDELKSLEDDDGMVVLPQYTCDLAPNQKVNITGGTLSGHVGIYQGQHSRDREKVLVAYLGKKIPVLIARQYLEAA